MDVYGCTLFEGRYHYGLGALLNSLYKGGFRGTFFAGYRGELPTWTTLLPRCSEDRVFIIGDTCRLCFVPVKTEFHLGNYKPTFMKQILGRVSPEHALCYFDPDITLKSTWGFIENWVQYGLALVEDCTYPLLPANHPLRLAWLKVVSSIGLTERRRLDRYYNSGFVGLSGTHTEALDVWERILAVSECAGYDRRKFTGTDRSALWQAADQDHLNTMVMTTDVPLTTIGPDGMDFNPGGYVMSHAVNSPKPWVRNYLRNALQGNPPQLSDKEFWKNVEYPIRLFPSSFVRQKRLEIVAALALGRIWRR